MGIETCNIEKNIKMPSLTIFFLFF